MASSDSLQIKVLLQPFGYDWEDKVQKDKSKF